MNAIKLTPVLEGLLRADTREEFPSIRLSAIEFELEGEVAFLREQICEMFRVPIYLIIGPKPRQWGNPEILR